MSAHNSQPAHTHTHHQQQTRHACTRGTVLCLRPNSVLLLTRTLHLLALPNQPHTGHCKRLAPTWGELAEAVKDNPTIKIAQVDCTVDRDVCTNAQVCWLG